MITMCGADAINRTAHADRYLLQEEYVPMQDIQNIAGCPRKVQVRDLVGQNAP